MTTVTSRSRSGVRCLLGVQADGCWGPCRWMCSGSCRHGQRQCGWRECMRCALTPPLSNLVNFSLMTPTV